MKERKKERKKEASCVTGQAAQTKAERKLRSSNADRLILIYTVRVVK
jgi:hypothetical protein